MQRIYLDYAASTPVAPSVVKAMKPFFSQKFGNPSSLHSFGREAEIATDEAREVIARFFGVDFGEVYFTSGATEANNWIIQTASRIALPDGAKPHVVTSTFEHESVLEPIRHLEQEGRIEATYLSPSKEGFIKPQDVEAALKGTTVLVSLLYINNEIGTVQPIKAIGRIIQKHSWRVPKMPGKLPLFHSDAVQAVQYGETRLDYLKLDAMTISAHKIGGPKGVGALIARNHVPLTPLLYGGGQEFERRPGTLNVPCIVGLGKAVELLQTAKGERETKRLSLLKRRLENGIVALFPEAIMPGKEPMAPHILNVIFPGIQAQVMLIALDQEGIAVSSGAACSVKSIRESHVLRALGYTSDEASSAIRFSFGKMTTIRHISQALVAIEKVLKRCSNRVTN